MADKLIRVVYRDIMKNAKIFDRHPEFKCLLTRMWQDMPDERWLGVTPPERLTTLQGAGGRSAEGEPLTVAPGNLRGSIYRLDSSLMEFFEGARLYTPTAELRERSLLEFVRGEFADHRDVRVCVEEREALEDAALAAMRMLNATRALGACMGMGGGGRGLGGGQHAAPATPAPVATASGNHMPSSPPPLPTAGRDDATSAAGSWRPCPMEADGGDHALPSGTGRAVGAEFGPSDAVASVADGQVVEALADGASWRGAACQADAAAADGAAGGSTPWATAGGSVAADDTHARPASVDHAIAAGRAASSAGDDDGGVPLDGGSGGGPLSDVTHLLRRVAPSNRPDAGTFMLAHPLMHDDHRQLTRTVVLLCASRDPNHVYGLVINRAAPPGTSVRDFYVNKSRQQQQRARRLRRHAVPVASRNAGGDADAGGDSFHHDPKVWGLSRRRSGRRATRYADHEGEGSAAAWAPGLLPQGASMPDTSQWPAASSLTDGVLSLARHWPSQREGGRAPAVRAEDPSMIERSGGGIMDRSSSSVGAGSEGGILRGNSSSSSSSSSSTASSTINKNHESSSSPQTLHAGEPRWDAGRGGGHGGDAARVAAMAAQGPGQGAGGCGQLATGRVSRSHEGVTDDGGPGAGLADASHHAHVQSEHVGWSNGGAPAGAGAPGAAGGGLALGPRDVRVGALSQGDEGEGEGDGVMGDEDDDEDEGVVMSPTLADVVTDVGVVDADEDEEAWAEADESRRAAEQELRSLLAFGDHLVNYGGPVVSHLQLQALHTCDDVDGVAFDMPTATSSLTHSPMSPALTHGSGAAASTHGSAAAASTHGSAVAALTWDASVATREDTLSPMHAAGDAATSSSPASGQGGTPASSASTSQGCLSSSGAAAANTGTVAGAGGPLTGGGSLGAVACDGSADMRVYLDLDLDKAAAALAQGKLSSANLHLFSGICRWTHEQLRREINEGSWVLASGPGELLFPPATGAPGSPGAPGTVWASVVGQPELWSQMLTAMGGEFAALARVPPEALDTLIDKTMS
eukprot:jgi/Mesvir1/548/Mv11402-RA.1